MGLTVDGDQILKFFESGKLVKLINISIENSLTEKVTLDWNWITEFHQWIQTSNLSHQYQIDRELKCRCSPSRRAKWKPMNQWVKKDKNWKQDDSD